MEPCVLAEPSRHAWPGGARVLGMSSHAPNPEHPTRALSQAVLTGLFWNGPGQASDIFAPPTPSGHSRVPIKLNLAARPPTRLPHYNLDSQTPHSHKPLKLCSAGPSQGSLASLFLASHSPLGRLSQRELRKSQGEFHFFPDPVSPWLPSPLSIRCDSSTHTPHHCHQQLSFP